VRGWFGANSFPPAFWRGLPERRARHRARLRPVCMIAEQELAVQPLLGLDRARPMRGSPPGVVLRPKLYSTLVRDRFRADVPLVP